MIFGKINLDDWILINKKNTNEDYHHLIGIPLKVVRLPITKRTGYYVVEPMHGERTNHMFEKKELLMRVTPATHPELFI